jgi:ParB family transcriptional regulator, chromosome partitioning protein
MLGIIDDISIHDLQHSPGFYPSISSGIDELTRSIKEKGLLHPITVRAKTVDSQKEGKVEANEVGEKRFEIVAGNRRYLACRALGWRKILCQIVELNDREAFELSLVENIQRRTLNPMEEAYAFKTYVSDFGWGGVSDLAERIGKSTSYVDRRLGLLHLPKDVLKKLLSSSLNISVAEELIPVRNEDDQSKLADLISRKRLSIRQVRELISNHEDSVYDSQGITVSMNTVEDISELDRVAHRSLDKSMVAFKIAMNKITDIMETVEDNWIIYEILMQHRNVLHSQVDLMIKEKKKL